MDINHNDFVTKENLKLSGWESDDDNIWWYGNHDTAIEISLNNNIMYICQNNKLAFDIPYTIGELFKLIEILNINKK
jgi:hypothetical protein